VHLAGSRIVVTGGTGFLGRHVSSELRAADAEVVSVGRPDYDLRRRDEIKRLLDHARPDAVIHLAAVVGGIGANRAEPGRFLYENAIMGLELVEACRAVGVAKVCLAGTVCSYPKYTPVPFREDDLWNGYPEETNAPYGLAKKLLLVQAQSYREQYDLNAICLILVNLYGPGDNFDLDSGHVIPAMIRKFVEARDRDESKVVLWGDGSATREFLYVGEAARAFRLALERYDSPEPVNIGSGQEVSIYELAELVARSTRYRGEIVWDDTMPNGQPRRRLDVSRAREWLGFEATLPLAAGLAQTVAWYEQNRD
jgi:GDP-L-fucose synthase